MSDPPPTPAAVTVATSRMMRTSNSPRGFARGCQIADGRSSGRSGKSDLSNRRPRSRTHTRQPAAASRQAAMPPPKPDPTMTASYSCCTERRLRPVQDRLGEAIGHGGDGQARVGPDGRRHDGAVRHVQPRVAEDLTVVSADHALVRPRRHRTAAEGVDGYHLPQVPQRVVDDLLRAHRLADRGHLAPYAGEVGL